MSVGSSLTVDFSEHPPHLLDVVQIQEECLWIPVILLERDSEAGQSDVCIRWSLVARAVADIRIGNIDDAPIILT